MRSTALIFAISAVLALPGMARAADASQGEILAKRWCSTCHVVAGDQKRASTDAPAFSAIASAPGFSPEKVAYFLLAPHPRMPDMNLSRREADDLAAYIATQKR